MNIVTRCLAVEASLKAGSVNFVSHGGHGDVLCIKLIFEKLGESLLFNVLAQQLSNAQAALITFAILVVQLLESVNVDDAINQLTLELAHVSFRCTKTVLGFSLVDGF